MLGGPTGPARCPLSFLSSLPCFYLDLFSYPFSYFFPSFLLRSFPLPSLLDASNPFVTLFHPFPFESFVARIRVRVRVSVNVRVSVGISTLLFVRLSCGVVAEYLRSAVATDSLRSSPASRWSV